ncbi:MAG TPA: hypothetical protein VK284_02840 [Streptosporangiaceae bacterium]|nr:hypothetical protein [Streptosporangiaceae bacterium]
MTSAPVPLLRRLAAEFLGSAFLAAVVIGSGGRSRPAPPGPVALSRKLEGALPCTWS